MFVGSKVKPPLYILLALPLALDWVTQSWGLRDSSNALRLITGVLLGVDIFFFSRLDLPSRRIVFIGETLAVTLIGYVGKYNKSSSR